jgi:peptidoglycan L-alanyl-D-glutamate endopeptidase CwlK
VSAGSVNTTSMLKPDRDLARLAPRFREAVEKAIAECKAKNLEAMVFEAHRSQQLQALYYARGRSVIPPPNPVTNAPTNRYSWHGYGLAVDVVHATLFWKPREGEAWFKEVAAVFARHGCKWGGDWSRPDLPHFQWGRCKPSPSDEARRLIDTEGEVSVWRAVGAMA